MKKIDIGDEAFGRFMIVYGDFENKSITYLLKEDTIGNMFSSFKASLFNSFDSAKMYIATRYNKAIDAIMRLKTISDDVERFEEYTIALRNNNDELYEVLLDYMYDNISNFNSKDQAKQVMESIFQTSVWQ